MAKTKFKKTVIFLIFLFFLSLSLVLSGPAFFEKRSQQKTTESWKETTSTQHVTSPTTPTTSLVADTTTVKPAELLTDSIPS